MHARLDSLPIQSARVLVFSDFNCPYCFMLNEWITELGLSDRIRWVGIEHRPLLPTAGPNNTTDADLLATEVIDVQTKAPGVQLLHPGVWTNSRYALLVQNALEDDRPEDAASFRRRIYRRYWQSGVLLSDEVAIRADLGDSGITEPFVEPDFLEELTAWWRTKLNRIPSMVAPTGVVHLGLQDINAVQLFLNGALHAADTGPGCS